MNNFKQFFNIEMRTKYFIHVLLCLFVASILIFILLIIGQKSLNQKEGSVAIETPNVFEELNLEAKSAVVWDVINKSRRRANLKVK